MYINIIYIYIYIYMRRGQDFARGTAMLTTPLCCELNLSFLYANTHSFMSPNLQHAIYTAALPVRHLQLRPETMSVLGFRISSTPDSPEPLVAEGGRGSRSFKLSLQLLAHAALSNHAV